MFVSREQKSSNTVVNVDGLAIGGIEPVHIFGPRAVESYYQTAKAVSMLKDKGLQIIRSGAFNPRTSPYDFQRLGLEVLNILFHLKEDMTWLVASEITASDTCGAC